MPQVRKWVVTDAAKAVSAKAVHGHSVGRWEGKTPVVETTNFSEHPMGSSTNVPASPQKKLTERFSLGEDGTSLMVSGTVEDPGCSRAGFFRIREPSTEIFER